MKVGMGVKAGLAAATLVLVGAVVIVSATVPQNLICNPGFENNPPSSFGDHVGYSIAPWVLATGIRSNVVAVDGGATFNYGIAGPALDADTATGVGI